MRVACIYCDSNHDIRDFAGAPTCAACRDANLEWLFYLPEVSDEELMEFLAECEERERA
jgi:hypothetical protein